MIDTLGRGNATAQAANPAEMTDLQVSLFAAHSTVSWDARDSDREKFDLPVLYLHRERETAIQTDRTLEIQIAGITGGEEIDLQIISLHAEITSGTPHTETQRIILPDRNCVSESPCVVRWAFNPQTTPSDFYTLRIKDIAGHILWQNPYDDRPDFVMLDTWDVAIDDYTVRIIYATLFPFARGQNDFDNRLAPPAVIDFIEKQFVPIITETWDTQFNIWGLGIHMHPDWDADHIMEIIITDGPFALFDNIGTLSQLIGADNQPTKECRIWWGSTNNSFQAYASLEAAVKAIYSHEFFHLVQRNILLFTDNPQNRWMNVFIEAQGKFAPSVQYPTLEMRRYGVQPNYPSEYLDSANRYLTHRLNSSYQEQEGDYIHKFDAALYWRFLYEQYGDMGFISTALTEMTKHNHTDIVQNIAQVMNTTFEQHTGSFSTYEDSLIAFARANYALRLREGHCKADDFTECGGNYYDPSGLYMAPPLETELTFTGNPVVYEGDIQASYGMDFIEINIEPSDTIHAVKVTLAGLSDVSEFSVQVWSIVKAIPHDYVMTADPSDITKQADGFYSYVLENLDTSQDLTLALIITRLDAQELEDPQGIYIVRVSDEFE